MSSRKTKIGKEAVFLAAAALFLLWGCGQGEMQQPQPSSFGEEQPASAGELSDRENAPEIKTAPLLTYEDPETENLAGMLQRQNGGMMVQLQAGKYLGSGVLYRQEEDSLLILTAGHVLSDAKDGVRVTFADGWEVETGDYQVADAADLAAVRVPLSEIPADRAETYCLVNVDKQIYDGMQAEDGCIAMGCRTGVAEDAYEGILLEPWIYMEDYGQYMMWVSAAGKPGMSGGGLFDRRGRFLGILSGRNDEEEWAVVPLNFILTEYS